ncbi:MAG: alpha/beta hydrolase [Candidatus Saccharimonadales bacterium]
MQVVVDSLITNYHRTGKGRQVLILHGWGDNSAGWQTFANNLAANFEIITLDLPGFGNTQAPRDDWGITEYAVFVAAFLDKVNLELYAILGHSNGGAIAIRGISNNSLRAKKLVLLASAGIRGEFNGRYRILRVITKTGKLLVSPLPKAAKKTLQHKVYRTIGSDMLVAEHLQGTFKKVIADDVRIDAQSIKLPTLLIYGQTDSQTPVRYGQLFHNAIAGSKLHIIPEADHFLHLTHGSQVLNLIKEFLK